MEIFSSAVSQKSQRHNNDTLCDNSVSRVNEHVGGMVVIASVISATLQGVSSLLCLIDLSQTPRAGVPFGLRTDFNGHTNGTSKLLDNRLCLKRTSSALYPPTNYEACEIHPQSISPQTQQVPRGRGDVQVTHTFLSRSSRIGCALINLSSVYIDSHHRSSSAPP